MVQLEWHATTSRKNNQHMIVYTCNKNFVMSSPPSLLITDCDHICSNNNYNHCFPENCKIYYCNLPAVVTDIIDTHIREAMNHN